MFSIETKDGFVHIETDDAESVSPVITREEHEAAARMFAETGCVPLDYASKIASGYVRLKAR